ncbi:MAG: calcium-binding protein, partial [Maritimibacter sp.]
TDGTDFFVLTEGDQLLSGGSGADYYFVGKDSGKDVIYDQDLGGADGLRFTDVYADQVTAIRDGQDLMLQIGSEREVRLTDQFLGELNAYLTNGKQYETGVNTIVFADGVVWDRLRMAMEVVDKDRAAGDYNDSLVGSGSADILWGGKGNDYLSGSAGGDYYIYERGDGQDVIDDQGAFSFGPVKAGIDFLRFQGDITADDLKLTRDGESGNLKITLLDADGNETSDTIEIVGQFSGVRTGLGLFSDVLGSSDGLDYVAPNLIERFIFEDGTSLEFTQIVDQVIANAKTDGDDAIYGMLNDNTLDGGAGDDFLSGKEGNDTYLFGRGYGRDVIIDNSIPGLFDPPQHDTLRFLDDIRWTDLEFLRDGPSDDLHMRVAGTDDEVILSDFLAQIPILGFTNLIEDIVFGDGTTWSAYKLAQHYIDVAKTDGDDTIYGYDELSDEIDGGAGNDTLIGFGGNETYHVAAGEGDDTILDSSGDDKVLFAGLASTDVTFGRTALDLVVTVKSTGQRFVLQNQYVRDGAQTYAVENMVFTDRTVSFLDVNPEDIDLVGTSGDDAITGSNFAETLDGRTGDDTLTGGDGGDIYKFDAGYGQDVIIDRRVRASWQDRRGVHVPVDDVVEFGGGIASFDDLVFTKDGDDLLISIVGRSDTLRIKNQFRDAEDGVELFRLFDGTTRKISDIEELLQIAGGNRGDNVIEGIDDQPNVLDGRQGDDTLIGGSKGDTYAFTAGYGFDTIIEKPDAANVIDRVIFGASVRVEDIAVSRNGNDLLIDLGSGVDVLTIVGGLTTTRVESYEFADGTVWTIDQIIDRMLTGTAADEHLIGLDNRDDTISGGSGSDALEGGLANDTYRFGLGDGSDSVYDTGGIDRVVFGAQLTSDEVSFANIGGDLLITIDGTDDRLVILSGYSAKPVESFEFADGTVLSIADVRALIRDGLPNSGQDIIDMRELPAKSTLAPGAGNDRIILAQDARVVIAGYDGIDSVEMPSGVTSATVVLESYGASDAVVRLASPDSTDLVIAFPASGDQLIVRGGLGGGALPTVEFADGVVWDAAALAQASIRGQESAGGDNITGSSRADSFAGGLGDDEISGGGGDDAYAFTRGDGQDVIDDASGNDTLTITGYRSDEMRVTQIDPSRSELLLTFADSTDQIVLRYTSGWSGIDAVRFSDGTAFSLDALRGLARATGTAQDDVLSGTSAAETFSAGAGDDVIVPGGGGDVIRFERGDGHDRIEGNSASDGLLTLLFGAGITLADIAVSRDADGNLVLALVGSDDRVTLVDPAGNEAPVVGT